MRRWLREPLLHFLLAGGLLFGAYAWLNRGDVGSIGKSARTVRITASQVDWLRETWRRQWQRPPTDAELRGLVSDYLKEQLLAHEARELGLDEDDTVVRRRLAQKMEFLLDDTARLAEPSDADLERVYAQHPERFRTEAFVSFEQVYFSPDLRGERAAADAKRTLSRLSADAAPADAADLGSLGDRILLEPAYERQTHQSVATLFGAGFADRLFALDAKSARKWLGPIESGYGLHLVRVSERAEPSSLAFAVVREKIAEEIRRERQAKLRDDYYATLLTKYDVEIDETVKPLVGPLGAETRGGP